MGRWPEATEAALAAVYGGNPVRDFWQQKITLRRLRVMVEHLPTDNAVTRHRLGHGWTDADELLARTVDALNIANEVVITANSDGKHEFEQPERTPRPGSVQQESAARPRSKYNSRNPSPTFQQALAGMTGKG